MMTVIRPPPSDAFLCEECVRPSACDCPRRFCLTHAIAFYTSLVRTGSALAFLTREVPLDVLRWLPLPTEILIKEPSDAPDEPELADESDPAPIVPRWVSRKRCVRGGCLNRRATRFGLYCDHHLYEARQVSARGAVRVRHHLEPRALKGTTS